jgi:hypothetical protein
MKVDSKLEDLDIIKNAWIDGDFVYICGKIGESTDFEDRARSCIFQHTGILSGIIKIILELFICFRSIGKSTRIFETRRKEIENITI